MLLTFTISVFEVLERYGICWTSDEQEAYLHTWDVIGDHLGIGRPTVKSGAFAGLGGSDDRLARRCSPSVGPRRTRHCSTRSAIGTGSTPGSRVRPTTDRRPVSAPADCSRARSSTSSRPRCRPLKLMPITVMRTLAPEVVRKRLSLGHNGVVIRALGQLPKRRNVIGRFTAISTPNPVFGRVLRYMANEVTGRASVHFLKESDYFFPGLERWSGGLPGDH